MTRNLDAYGVADDDELVLDTPEQFKALGHPLRHRLVNVLRQRPATLGQLAAVLGSTKGTVGYHVKVLLDSGLLRPARTRTVRGGTEQYFELVASTLRPELPGIGGAQFLLRAAADEMIPGDPEQTLLTHVRLTEDQANDLIQRLAGVARGLGDDDGEAYGILLSVYRTDVPRLPSE